jgi:cytochrome c peroxidase
MKHTLVLVLAFGALAFSAGLVLRGDGEPSGGAATKAAGAEPISAPLGAPGYLYGPIPPLPEPPPLDAAKVALGRRLFHDANLSSDRTISCATCHDLSAGGDDGLPVSIGVGGAAGERNSPTVLNSGFNFRQFWDGRAATLEEQVDGPILGAVEMDMQWDEIVERLSEDRRYVRDFEDLYSSAPTPAGVKDALATFERSLVTSNSPFDRYLRGDAAALSAEALRGYELFREVGCTTCHQGVNAGGNMFQPLGAFERFFAEKEVEATADAVHPAGVGTELFKVPGLRNVALTAPYFHDGSVATLDEAVRVMARYQLGVVLERADIERIAAFLESLTGELPPSAQ